jgi:hypothetical protein
MIPARKLTRETTSESTITRRLSDLRDVAASLAVSKLEPLRICQAVIEGKALDIKTAAFFAGLPPEEKHYWVSSLYALLIPRNRRRKLAAYFTPPHLAAHAVDLLLRAGIKPGIDRILDPADVAELNSRDLLVRTRTKLINAVRGMIKTAGFRLPAIGPESFVSKASPLIPEQLRSALMPLVQTISEVTLRIRDSDKRLERIARDRYPETLRLRQVHGVGPVTALQFVLTVGDPLRFRKSRDLGPYIGLVPKKRQSGDVDKQMRISKAGNRRLRSLLVQCSNSYLAVSALIRISRGGALRSRAAAGRTERDVPSWLSQENLPCCYTGSGSQGTSTIRYTTHPR